MNAKDSYLKDLDSLIERGVDLQKGLYNELKDEFKQEFSKIKEVQMALFKSKSFKDKYDVWHNETYMLVKQLIPSRLKDFMLKYCKEIMMNLLRNYGRNTISLERGIIK